MVHEAISQITLEKNLAECKKQMAALEYQPVYNGTRAMRKILKACISIILEMHLHMTGTDVLVDDGYVLLLSNRKTGIESSL